MNRCKTCAHWDRKYHIEPDQRLCLAKKLDSTEPDGARIAYVERRHAMFLATSPEFGCVHHTPIAGVKEARGGCECAACKVVPHASDCAVHNEPAMPAGPCDCGAWLRRARELVLALLDADRASERSVAKGGPELDEPFAVAFDALDDHLKACAAGVAAVDEPDGIRAFLHALQARNEKDNGLFPQVAHEVEADAKALRRVLAVLDFYHPPRGVKTCERPGCTSPALPLFKFCKPHAADAAHNNGMDLS